MEFHESGSMMDHGLKRTMKTDFGLCSTMLYEQIPYTCGCSRMLVMFMNLIEATHSMGTYPNMFLHHVGVRVPPRQRAMNIWNVD